MTRKEARKLIHDKNNGLIEITEEQKKEILEHYSEEDMKCMVNLNFDHRNCFNCNPSPSIDADHSI